MTRYTDNRRYPYPSSPREAGNGAAASEALARAVAADLDVLDAGWNVAPIRSTKIIGLSADSGGFSSGNRTSWTPTTIVQTTGAAYTTATSEIRVMQDGWYEVNLNFAVAPTGALTVSSRLENWITHYRSNSVGTLITQSEREGDTYWPSATANLYNRVSGMFRMLANDRIWVYWQHGNAASTVKVLAQGSTLQAVRVRSL